jgi:hypothetical protein
MMIAEGPVKGSVWRQDLSHKEEKRLCYAIVFAGGDTCNLNKLDSDHFVTYSYLFSLR